MSANKETWSAQRVKALTMRKIHCGASGAERVVPRRFPTRFAAIAAVTLLAIALVTTTLAASGVIHLGSIFPSIFDNERAAPYVQEPDDRLLLTDAELIVEPMAAFFETAAAGGLYLDLQITDPTGGRLSDSLSLLYWNEALGFYDALNPFGEAYVRFIDNYTVHAGFWLSSVSGHDEETGELIVRFQAIASGIHLAQEQPTGFNIGAHIGAEKPIFVPGAEFIQITGLTLREGAVLTITHRDSGTSPYGWGSAQLALMKPDGEIIRRSRVQYACGAEQETVFNIGTRDPKDLTLLWSGQAAAHTMPGDWEFRVFLDHALEPRLFEGTFAGYPTQLSLGGTSVGLLITAYRFDIFEDNTLTLYLADGTTVQPRFDGAESDHEMAWLTYSMDFVHPDDVVRVTFRGREIGGAMVDTGN